MAYFAELDKDNEVLRVVVACDTDISNNGGEQSTQAAEHFKTVVPLSPFGVRWVQTSDSFRKQLAGQGYTYDETKDKFIRPQPFPSWVLDANDDWQPPVAYPTHEDGETNPKTYSWDEENQQWVNLYS